MKWFFNFFLRIARKFIAVAIKEIGACKFKLYKTEENLKWKDKSN